MGERMPLWEARRCAHGALQHFLAVVDTTEGLRQAWSLWQQEVTAEGKQEASRAVVGALVRSPEAMAAWRGYLQQSEALAALEARRAGREAGAPAR